MPVCYGLEVSAITTVCVYLESQKFLVLCIQPKSDTLRLVESPVTLGATLNHRHLHLTISEVRLGHPVQRKDLTFPLLQLHGLVLQLSAEAQLLLIDKENDSRSEHADQTDLQYPFERKEVSSKSV